ncbi:MAG: hypothetical protein AB7V45_11515 [Candidatus Krumholzibacteriia bacterium]
MSPFELNHPAAGPTRPPEHDDPAVDPAFHREAAEVLLTIDRLMTVGTYYETGHAKYRAVSRECEAALHAALAARQEVSITLVEGGLAVFGQRFPAGSREARRLYSLMDPLGLALLEIHPGVTADEFLAALAILQERRNALSAATDFEEIRIQGLPPTVSVMTRGLFMRTRNPDLPPGADSSPARADGNTADPTAMDPHLIPAELLVQGADLQKCEREFLTIVDGLVKAPARSLNRDGRPDGRPNGRPDGGPDTGPGGDSAATAGKQAWIPPEILGSISEIIAALGGTNSDPLVFEHLIAHAREALKATADAAVVDLLFENMRREVMTQGSARPRLIGASRARKRRNPEPSFTMTAAELVDAYEGLEIPAGPLENPAALDRAGALGLCVLQLQGEPGPDLVEGVRLTINRIVGDRGFGGPERSALAAAVAAIFSREPDEAALTVFEMLWEPLRTMQPHAVGPVWLEVWRRLKPAHRRHVWPYTVNDILLGLAWRNPLEALALYGQVSRVRASEDARLLYVLESLPALKDGRIGKEVFAPPPPLLFPVLQVLIGSSLSAKLGPPLHDHLLKLQTHPLAVVMLEAAAEYHPGNRVVYQAILEQGVREKLTPRMVELGGRLLTLAILRLPPGSRTEPWLADAVRWLGKLAPRDASDALNRIVTEKKLFVMPAWPKELRLAAEQAWLSLGEEGGRSSAADRLGAYDVENEDPDIFAEPVGSGSPAAPAQEG